MERKIINAITCVFFAVPLSFAVGGAVSGFLSEPSFTHDVVMGGVTGTALSVALFYGDKIGRKRGETPGTANLLSVFVGFTTLSFCTAFGLARLSKLIFGLFFKS